MEAKFLARVVAVCGWVVLVHACGPDELPAFANPPPVDSHDGDDAGVDTDAGPQAR